MNAVVNTCVRAIIRTEIRVFHAKGLYGALSYLTLVNFIAT